MQRVIAQLGQPVLYRAALPITPEEIGGDSLRDLIRDMKETLVVAGGVGLAAPQVAVSKRLFLAAVLPKPGDDETLGVEVFINPRLTVLTEARRAAWEGCLSFPELLVRVERPTQVRIDYLDELGIEKSLELKDFPARVVQHELDHLNGVLTLERVESNRDIIKASEIESVLADAD